MSSDDSLMPILISISRLEGDIKLSWLRAGTKSIETSQRAPDTVRQRSRSMSQLLQLEGGVMVG